MPKAPRKRQCSPRKHQNPSENKQSNPKSNSKPQSSLPPPQSASLLRAQFNLLTLIWPRDPRIPSVESRRAWALARGLNPNNVHAWWYRRRRAAKKLRIAIPKEIYELDVEEAGFAVDDGLPEIKTEEGIEVEEGLVGDTPAPTSDGLKLSSTSTLPVVPVSDLEEAPIDSDDIKIAHLPTKRHNTRAYTRLKTALNAGSNSRLLSCSSLTRSSPLRSSPGLQSPCLNFGSRYSSLPPSSPQPEVESRSPSPVVMRLYLCTSPSPSPEPLLGSLFNYSMRPDPMLKLDADLELRMDTYIQLGDDCHLKVSKTKGEGETQNCASDAQSKATESVSTDPRSTVLCDEEDMVPKSQHALDPEPNLEVNNSDVNSSCNHADVIREISHVRDTTSTSYLPFRKSRSAQCTSNVVLPLNPSRSCTWRQHSPLLFRPQDLLKRQLGLQTDLDLALSGVAAGDEVPMMYTTWCLDGYRVALDGSIVGGCGGCWEQVDV